MSCKFNYNASDPPVPYTHNLPIYHSSYRADCGATDTLFRVCDAKDLHHVQYKSGRLTVKLPNDTTISSIGTGFLHGLGASVPAHIFNDCDLQQSLLSLSSVNKAVQ
jgi:hypothetical protein